MPIKYTILTLMRNKFLLDKTRMELVPLQCIPPKNTLQLLKKAAFPTYSFLSTQVLSYIGSLKMELKISIHTLNSQFQALNLLALVEILTLQSLYGTGSIRRSY